MNRRGGTKIAASRKPIVVLAGEDRSDRASIRVLLEDLCPDTRGRIVEIGDSVRLRDAGSENLKARVTTLRQKVKARAARESADIACVFVHEDFDQPHGDTYETVRTRVEGALLGVFSSAHYVLAVAEMEAWLLLFPDAVAAHKVSWSVPAKYRNRDTGMIADPKRVLMRECTPERLKYRETDAPDVFARAAQMGRLERPVGRNDSWSRFRREADECCRSHIPRPRTGQ
ncbi:hypothetical protein SAMN05421812_101713 [Asanoa hainanensis]|uniref:DUF4276 family protein n=1 Tax=Asanoa hainanensis TaxID=560556 RepID=A0A239H721_9ACTN|nr:hypothetical protein [Asanoa hainanensis]SNS76828.1 hypothetical protein SAMN05421812_101713 [Asanoa hainanensis]